jgi:transketolase
VIETRSDLEAMTQRVRRHIVRMVYRAKSGHIGGSMSSTDIMSVLYARFLRHDPARPDWPDRDRFIMSKGHCTPVQYAVMAESGYFPVEELDTFRQKGSRLQGHSVRGKPPGVENSAGALGMGLSFGLGARLGARLQGRDLRAWVLMGDGEQDEGQVWEAAMAAAHHAKYHAFGWEVRAGVDGHNLQAIEDALRWATEVRGGPACVIFDTVKGKGVSFMENNPAFHAGPPSDEQFAQAMRELGEE